MKKQILFIAALAIAIFVECATAATPTPSPSPTASGSPKSGDKDAEWVIYSTEVGWLRVGPRTEYEAKWAKKDEINGGTSEERLKKKKQPPRGFARRLNVLRKR